MNGYSEERSVRPIAETLSTQEEIINLYEDELVRVKAKLRARNAERRKSLQAKIKNLENGTEYRKLQAELNRIKKKNEELKNSLFSLKSDNMRLRRMVEAKESERYSAVERMKEAEKKMDKAERTVRNLQLWMEMSSGKRRTPTESIGGWRENSGIPK